MPRSSDLVRRTVSDSRTHLLAQELVDLAHPHAACRVRHQACPAEAVGREPGAVVQPVALARHVGRAGPATSAAWLVAPALAMPRDHGLGLAIRGVSASSRASAGSGSRRPDRCRRSWLASRNIALQYRDLLVLCDALQGESRSISEQCVDESEELRDPGIATS